MTNALYITREKRGLGHPAAAFLIRRAIRRVISAENISCPVVVNVMLTDDESIRAINCKFREVDSATDVLSFPMNNLIPGDFNPNSCEFDPSSGRILLGDIVISVTRCEKQGAEFGHGFNREIMYLTVHSMLHLLGYDHVDEGEMKKQMRNREKLIMGDE